MYNNPGSKTINSYVWSTGRGINVFFTTDIFLYLPFSLLMSLPGEKGDNAKKKQSDKSPLKRDFAQSRGKGRFLTVLGMTV
jgi:hypothetical protein